jgi:uncharacterized OB-fold protein
MAEPRRPRPAADALTAPFWEAAREGRLVVQRCGACGTWQHPPATRCHRCGESERLAWTPAGGDATVVSWTRVEQGLVAGFEQVVPYLVVVVELAEQQGLYLLTDVPGAHPWAIRGPRVGEPVRVTFQAIDDTLSLPQFRPVGDAR